MYKIILTIRYLLKRRITYFAELAVALCVFIVVVVMTVMTGLVSDFKQKNHRFVGDCIVGTESLVGFAYYEDFVEMLEGADFIEGVSPVIKSYALINRKGSEPDGVEILGIDPVRHSRATGFGKTLHYTRNNALRKVMKATQDVSLKELADAVNVSLEEINIFLEGSTALNASSIDAIVEYLGVQLDVSESFKPAYDPNLTGCVLGIDLPLQRYALSQYTFKDSPDRIGYSISCFPLTARGAPAQAGTDMVNTKTFYFSDNSDSGLPKVDSSLAYLPFEMTQLLCGMAGSVKRTNAIHIKFKPYIKLQDGCNKVASLWKSFRQERADEKQAYLLDTVTVQSWKVYRRASIAPMENEQIEMTVMFCFVAVAVVFIVFVVFYMIISHKSKDIGILKSIGVSNIDIIGLFSGFAFLVGLLGSCLGLFASLLFLENMNRIEGWLFERFHWQLFDRTIYAIGDLPSRASPKLLGVIALSAIIACLAGALVPSWQAARQKPVETLQVNQL